MPAKKGKMGMSTKNVTTYNKGGEKLLAGIAKNIGKDKAMGILQSMAMGGESLDLVEMGVEAKYGLEKKTFGGRTDGSRTYSGK